MIQITSKIFAILSRVLFVLLVIWLVIPHPKGETAPMSFGMGLALATLVFFMTAETLRYCVRKYKR